VNALETSMLVPGAGFVIATLMYLILAIVWPAVDAARQGRWLWVLCIVLFSPLAGGLWFALRLAGRRQATA
jgi:hypothetical protein